MRDSMLVVGLILWLAVTAFSIVKLASEIDRLTARVHALEIAR